MPTIPSREGVISFAADGDVSDPTDAAARIFTIIVHDGTGAATATIRKGSVTGPIIFDFTPSGTAGDFPYYFYGSLTTDGGLYFAGTGAADVYIR